MIAKVTDPTKIVTDKLVLKQLAKQGIDSNYVEFFQDFAPRSLGREHSPYAKFYRDLKSGKHIMVTSGLPKVKPDGTKIEVGWVKHGDRYVSKPNLFSSLVEGTQITVTCLGDQPDGRKEWDSVTWKPQLYFKGKELTPKSKEAALLLIDPTNSNITGNTLEWDYGICKRRLRIIQGRIREKWLFESDPMGEVRIKHNQVGELKLRMGEYGINGDEELVPREAFIDPEFGYPVTIGASPETFYPDEGVNSVDGYAGTNGEVNVTWNALINANGTKSSDSSTNSSWYCQKSGTNNQWKQNIRPIQLFYTEPLPDACKVTGVVLTLTSNVKYGSGVTFNIDKTNPTNDTSLVNGDYNIARWSSVKLATGIAIASWNDSGGNDFTLIDVDTDDFGYISKTGLTKLGCRLEEDIDNSAPAWGDATQGCVVRNVEDGGGNEPKLVVTYYTLQVPVADGDLIGIGIIRKS